MKSELKEYKVVVTRISTVSYEDGEQMAYGNTHKKDDKGDDIWADMPKPAHVTSSSEEVFAQRTPQVDLLALVAAINGVDWKRD